MNLNKNKNEKILEKLVECPQCLGLGLVYEPALEKDETCNMCKGKGKVKESVRDNFDPFFIENLTDNEIDDGEE
jgi:DnaJ-class molecular chaperone